MLLRKGVCGLAGQQHRLHLQVVKSCRDKGAKAADMLVADLTTSKGVDALASAAQKTGTVGVLVSNAETYAPMSSDQGDNKGQGPLDGKPFVLGIYTSADQPHVQQAINVLGKRFES